MNDPTPPPERPLPDAARTRIRAELLEHAHRHRSTAPRWLVPAGAAAAVALVAGLGYWAISPGGSGPDSLPVTGGGTSGVVESHGPTPQGTSDPSTLPSASGTVSGSEGTTPTPGSSVPASGKPDGGHQVGTGTCPVELENVLKGAQEAVAFPTDAQGGTTSIYVKGEQFSLCDTRAGTTTVTHPLPVVPVDEAQTYRVLSIYPPTDDGYRTVRVAGGRVPDGVTDFDAAYTFPDGHVEHSTTATDSEGHTWWRMVYAYASGGGNETELPGIQVTVSMDGEEHQGIVLGWGVDTCAQANHGC
jgi:hypothetical protein